MPYIDFQFSVNAEISFAQSTEKLIDLMHY